MKESIPPILRPEHLPPLSFAGLVEHFGLKQIIAGDVAITGISMNTADLRAGDLFVAMPGMKTHGAQFAEKALALGAVAIVTDAAGADLVGKSVPLAILENPREHLGQLAAYVYGNSGNDMPLIFATTGTNGKTSTTYLLEAMLRQLGQVTGLTSTAERHIAGEVIVSRLTTPESTEMHALIARMRERDVTSIAIEVSAQAMTQKRVDGLLFDIAGFTNLSHDHLDDYGDMPTYFGEKAKLFKPEHAKRGVICLDSEYGQQLVEASEIPVVTITHKTELAADYKVRVTKQIPARTEFEVTLASGETLRSSIPLIGAHMAYNAGLAIAMLVEAGFEFATIAKAIANGVDVYMPGRTERVSGESGPNVFVDFGHSPDAFLNTLAAVRSVTSGRVLMLFGADGDRDATKRPEMSRVSAEGSDILVITDHHPRFEDPASIRATLVAEAKKVRPDHEVHEVSPPEAAIRAAISLVGEGDSILWAGPGHQDYRDIRGVRTVYSARQEARDALREAGWQ